MIRPRLVSAILEDKSSQILKLWPTIYVVDRSECRFRRYKMRARTKKAISAVRLKAETDFLDVVAGTDYALGVFIEADLNSGWASVMAFPKQMGSDERYVPSSFAKQSLESGYRLIENQRGFEGQFWSENHLCASRWWRNLPDKQAWQLFIRGATPSVDLSMFPVPPISFPIERTNFTFFDLNRRFLARKFSPRRILILATVLGVYFLSYSGGQYIKLSSEASRIQNEVSAVESSVQNSISIRRQALYVMDSLSGGVDELQPRELLYFFQDFQNVTRPIFKELGASVLDGQQMAAEPTIESRAAIGADDFNGRGLLTAKANLRLPEIQSIELDGTSITIRLLNVPDLDVPSFVKLLQTVKNFDEVSVSPAAENALVIRGVIIKERRANRLKVEL